MKLHRFSASTVALLAAWFVLSLTACRQTSTEPSNDNNNTNSDSCCGGALVLSTHDSATGHAMTTGTYVLHGNGTSQTQHVNDHGQVIFNHLCPGTYEVVGEAEHYNRHVEHYTLGCNDEQHHDYNMGPQTTTSDCTHGAITLILRDSATGDAISGGTVTLWHGSTNLGSQTINPNGNSWDGLRSGGEYSFSVTKDGYNHYEWNLDALGCDEHRTTDRRIGTVRHETNCDNASITLTVMDSVRRDTPVAGATVRIRIDGRNDVVTGTTDDHGHVMFNHLLGHTTYIISVAGTDHYYEKGLSWQLGDCREYTESVWLAPR